MQKINIEMISKDSPCSLWEDKVFLLENSLKGGTAATDLKMKKKETQSHTLYLKFKKTTRCNYIHD